MRIMHIVSYLDVNFGGHEFWLSKALSGDNQVVLFTSDKKPPRYRKKEDVLLKDEKINDNFLVKRVPAGPEVSFVPLMPTLFFKLLLQKADVIHTHEYFQPSSFYAAIISIFKRIPLVLTQHGYSYSRNPLMNFLHRLAERTFGKFVRNVSKKIIALTDEQKKVLLDIGVDKRKIVVIPTGIDTKTFNPENESALGDYGFKKSDKIILFVGRLTENKAADILIRAFARTKKKDWKLLIVGDGEERENLERLSKELGVDHNVAFVNNIPNSKMPGIFAGADIFVLPSKYEEPFGIVLLEAMASGNACIGSNLGGIKTIIKHGENGLLTKPGDVEDLETKLEILMKNKKLRKKLSGNGIEHASQNYSWEKIKDRIVGIYPK